MRTHAGATALLALLLVGAGCLGLGGGEEPTPSDPNPSSPGGEPLSTTEGRGTPGNLSAFTYDVEATGGNLTVNGTFEAADPCFPAGCLTGSYMQAHDVSGLVPTGVPVHLTAELRWSGDATPFFPQSVELGFHVEDGEIYAYEEGAPEEGVGVLRTTLVAASPGVEVLVFHHQHDADGPPTEYTLTVETEVPQSTLVPGVPTQLHLETGQGVFLETAPDQRIEVAVYNPADRLVTHLTSEGPRYDQVVPPEAPSGSYVLVATGESGPVHLSTNGTAGTLAALDRTYQLSEPEQVDPGDTASWSFDLRTSPLQVGLYTTSGQQGAVTMTRGNGTLAGPDGTLAEGEVGCGTCITFGGFYALASQAGDPGLVPGTYQASYTASQELGTQVGHYVVLYERR